MRGKWTVSYTHLDVYKRQVSNAVRDDMRACLPAWPAERIETLYNLSLIHI